MEQDNRLDPMDIRCRLDELRRLEDGWLEGDGTAPGSDELEWLTTCFGHHYPDDLPLPYLYPTTEDGVRAEWSLSDKEISLDVNLGTRRAGWHSLDLKTDSDYELELNLDNESDWGWIASEISLLAKPGTLGCQLHP